MQPIWKDYYIDLGANSYRDYEVQVDGEVIFSGRAYLRPDEDTIKVKINDICADYLASSLPDFSQDFTLMDISRTFVVVVGGAVVETVTFVNDWSYDPTRVITADTLLSDPILPELDPRQAMIISVAGSGVVLSATLTFEDGSTIIRSITPGGSYNASFNWSYEKGGTEGPGVAVLDLSVYSGLVRVEVGGISYAVRQNGCARYAVYYINAYGGWDSLVLAHGKRTDNLTRHTTKYDYDNSNPSNRGARDYSVEVSPSWELITDWLTRGDKMHHLLNSPLVYLYDLEEQVFIPVNLENTDSEYRDRFTNYTFNARLAREQYRR